MKTNASLVRSNCGIELYAETIVYVNLTLVIYPGNAEQDLSLGSGDSLKKCILTILLFVCLDHDAKGLENLFYCLMELGLSGVLSYYQIINLINI